MEFLAGLRAAPLRGGFGFMLDRDDALQAIALVDEVVSDLPDPLTEECIAPLRADFTAIHRSLGYRAHPAERDWMTGEGKPVAGLADSLRRWRQRAGLPLDGLPPDNLPLNEPPLAAGPAPDHLVSELDLLATLLEHGQAADATLFLDQHPLRWVPGFLQPGGDAVPRALLCGGRDPDRRPSRPPARPAGRGLRPAPPGRGGR
ncbi:molecular chaperone TorD family protein [Azospirillum doebereinerae]|uniref:molecular chaperone TorD family protein n=1 Tax=Azospirillum doebereinerae TaxID=92933 RepID=UPI00384BD88A